MKPNVLLIVLPYLKETDESLAGYWGNKYAKKECASTKMNSWPALPYGVLSIATYCKEVANIRILDCNVEEDFIGKLNEVLREHRPSIVGINMTFDNSYKYMRPVLDAVRYLVPNAMVVVGGAATAPVYDEILENNSVDAVCYGEGEIPFRELCQGHTLYNKAWVERRQKTPPAKCVVSNLDHIISLDYSFVNPEDYYMAPEFSPYAEDLPDQKRFFITTSKGCPYRCLSGETLVNTIEGEFPIKDLVGKSIKVLTRNPGTQEPMYADAFNIRKIEDNADVVRVNFDDGSSIVCTPDHRFKVFKPKNQFIEETEWEMEAKDLQPKQHVRAIRFDVNKRGRKVVSTRRDIEIYHARIVMESMIGRKLDKSENVHHKDRNQGNDIPSNLVLTDYSHHHEFHPEISERMRIDNPAKNMTPEWREKLIAAASGKKRSLEQRLRYRESKLGSKNPMYRKEAYHQHPGKSRIQEVNHRVSFVEHLPTREDVYCMEVPGVNWFYANNVLVHNCGFCYRSRENDRKMRYASIDAVMDHVDYLVDKYDMNVLTICDDQFMAHAKRAKKILQRLVPYKLRVELLQGVSVAFIDEEMADLMYKAGVRRAALAIESGCQEILDKMVDKPVNLDKAKETIKILRKAGLWVTGLFVMGFPGETSMQRWETISWILDADLDWCTFSPAIPIKGTKLYDICVEGGYIRNDIKLGEMDFSNYSIGPDSEEVAKEIYRMNLLINFVKNRSMRHRDYETALKSFEQVLKMCPNHAYAQFFKMLCMIHLERDKFYTMTKADPQWQEYVDELLNIGGVYGRNKTTLQH